MIKSIVFDVDDTIYDQQAPFVTTLKKVFPDFLKLMPPINQVYLRFRYYSDLGFPKVAKNIWNIVYFRFWRIKETLLEFNFREITEAEGNYFQSIYGQELGQITMLDEMRLTLDFLTRQQIPIGIITNGPLEHQLKKVKQLGLYDYVQPSQVIVSGATEFQKPEQEIFNLAATKFALDPLTTLYVGDNYQVDVVGAHNAGWKSLWFNHRNRSLPENIEPVFDLEIDSFAELFDTVKVLFDFSTTEK